MTSVKLNTHHYDGGLKNSMSEIADLIQYADQHESEFEDTFGYLEEMMAKYHSESSLGTRSLDVILNTFRAKGVRTQSENYDPTNGIHAEHLLYLISLRIIEEIGESPSGGGESDAENESEGTGGANESEGTVSDYLNFLVCQLEEMQSGICAQGRTHRLLQLVLTLPEDFREGLLSNNPNDGD